MNAKHHKAMIAEIRAIANVALTLAQRDYDTWTPVHMTWGRLFHVYR